MKTFITHSQNGARLISFLDFNDRNVRRIAVAGAGVTFASVPLLVSLQTFYAICGFTLAGAYTIFPNEIEAWLEAHQPHLLGASLGFLNSGPLGLVMGAWLGHYINKKANQMTEKINRAVEAVKPVTAPFYYANRTMQGAWEGLKNAYNVSARWLSSPENEKTINEPPAIQEKPEEAKSLFMPIATVEPDSVSIAEKPAGSVKSNINWLWTNYSSADKNEACPPNECCVPNINRHVLHK